MSEATQSELAKVKKGETIASAMLKGKHWEDWLIIAEALDIGKNIAMRRANTNAREGKGYCTAFSEWLGEPGHENLRRISGTAMVALERCLSNRESIEKWRATLTDDQRLQWNHPQTVWTHYERNNIVPEAKDEEGEEQETEQQEPEAEEPESEGDPSIHRIRNAATAEFVEWTIGAVEDDRLSIPTVITWLEEMDVKEAIGYLKDYAKSHVTEDA